MCNERGDYNDFIKKYFPDCRAFCEGRATNQNAITRLSDSFGDSFGYICSFTMVKIGSELDYVPSSITLPNDRILKSDEYLIDKKTGEVLSIE